MTGTLHFLPWMRSGLGLGLPTSEPETVGPLDEPDTITGSIGVNNLTASAALSLRPPHHVTQIDTQMITRRYPSPNVTDAEYDYFPHIELLAPDLPWLASPYRADETTAASGSTGRLRPWLVLVCFPVERGTLSAASPDSPQELTVDANDLPDLTESWAWAHIQSAVPPAEATSAAANATGQVIARLVCPRRLEASKRYRAALVNAWYSAATEEAPDAIAPAWTAGAGMVTLKTYDTWTFTTGDTGSFEALVERLRPAPDGEGIYGLHPMDMSRPGMVEPFDEDLLPVRTDFVGALRAVGTTPKDPGTAGAVFAADVEKLLLSGIDRQEIGRYSNDPIVTAPYYGSFPIDDAKVGMPQTGWLRELNLLAHWRAAAGIGAAIVRRHQERLVAQAWDQVGEVREANRVFGRTLLRRSVSERLKAKTFQLDPAQALGVLSAQLSFQRNELGHAVKASLRASTVPNGAVSAAMARTLRPSNVVQKTLTAPTRRIRFPGDEPVEGREQWRGMLADQLKTADTREQIRLHKPRWPDGMRTRPGGLVGTGGPKVDLERLKGSLQTTLAPARTARRQAELRVPALAGLLAGDAADALPSMVRTGPVYAEALATTLQAISPSLLLPGIETLRENSVLLVETDAAFVAAVLVGANHEMSRELLWREFPADMRHTAFRRFWPRPDPTSHDIDPIASWGLKGDLARMGRMAGSSLVLVVRGDVLRQFPSARFLLSDPAKSEPMAPSFSGRLPPDTAYFGFDVSNRDAVTAPGSEWLVVIEEPAFEPRFGLDAERNGSGTLMTYSELSWHDLQNQSGPHLSVLAETQFASNSALGGEATWGLNGAHMARITLQQPVRWICRAVDLLGGGG